MKIIIAPDSFRECCSATEVANSIKRGIHRVLPDAEILAVPVADGGEGTVDAILAAQGGHKIIVDAHDPLMRKIKSFFGILTDKTTGIIEMSAASGIALLKEEEKNPWNTTTYGTGELIREALDRGCKKLVIGLGGSATNDAGAGMVQALGVKLMDRMKQEIKPAGGFLNQLETIDMSSIDKRVYETEILVACDVTNPLTGEKGASLVYGPQKGGNKEMLEKLDENLKHFARKIKEFLNKEVEHIPGTGASGGIAAGLLAFLNARLMPGIDLISDTIMLEEKMRNADLVITGEGKMDSQTKFGKTPFGVAKVAAKFNLPVIGIAGTLSDDASELYSNGFEVLLPIINKPMSLAEAISNAPLLLEQTGERLGRMLKLKMNI
ncbi:glycerate kinase [Bacteroidota bacterium]